MRVRAERTLSIPFLWILHYPCGMRIKGSLARGVLCGLGLALIPTSSYSSFAAGPQTPSCGNYTVTTNEVIVGVKFPKGTYQINTFGISCSEVMGSKGLVAQFLKLKDKDPLPKPWNYLADAIGATKFSSGPGVGFRVQSITSTTASTPTPTATATPTATPLSTSTPAGAPALETEVTGPTCSRNKNALRNC